MSKTLGQSLESLKPEQRAERYRQFAEDALKRAAAAAGPDQRSEYIAMAASWHTMAMEAEKNLDLAALEAAKDKAGKRRAKEQH